MKIITITPDKNKVVSILRMSELTLEMVKTIDIERFPTNIIKEYYEIIREMISVIILLDGFKIIGDKAHKGMIDYLERSYKEFSKKEMIFVDELRELRNKIAYNGFFVRKEFVYQRLEMINTVIHKLKSIINFKIASVDKQNK